MNKLVSVAALTLAAIAPAWSNEAADLLVKACLPAMDDLANVDAIGREMIGPVFVFPFLTSTPDRHGVQTVIR